MRHKIFIMVSIFCLIALSSMVISTQAQSVFKIGVIDNDNGPLYKGAQLAVNQLNRTGGVSGAEGTNYILELVVYPLEQVDEFSKENVIAIIGPETTNDVLNILPELQALSVPILTSAIGDTLLSSDISQNIFHLRAFERLHGYVLANTLVNDLGMQTITTVQLDEDSTAGRVGFSIALESMSPRPQEITYIIDTNITIDKMVSDITAQSQQVVVGYGSPGLISDFYKKLRAAGWGGLFVYSQADHPNFRINTPIRLLDGILGVTTWSPATLGEHSEYFLTDFVRTYAAIPGPIEAASYDGVHIIASAIGLPGSLIDNINATQNISGAQGILNRNDSRELSDNTYIILLNSAGGSEVIARYSSFDRLPEDGLEEVLLVQITPTATLDGAYLIIENTVQNIRTGPSVQYDVLGQLQKGDMVEIIGATIDLNWVVIEYRGQNGWLATYLLEIIGDTSKIPVISPPPTPTAGPPTAIPTPSPIPDIIISSAAPSNISLGVSSNISVTVANIGAANATQFAIAATFPPDEQFASFTFVNGLAAGQQQTISLPVTLSKGTGHYQVVIVADLNGEVIESEAGEANNNAFVFSYKVDKPVALINTVTLATGASLDLEAGVTPLNDVQYLSDGLHMSNACTGSNYCIGVLSPNFSWETAHYNAVSSENGITGSVLPNSSLPVGTILGLLTAEGRRAIVRVDAINPGVSITLTYQLYQP